MEDLNEQNRINYLHSLNILDTDYDAAFDNISNILQTYFNIPIVLISLVDTNRQWFKSCIGLNVRETEREVSFCSDAIKEDTELYIVQDTLTNDLYKNNRLVIHEPFIRFYAGKPLIYNNFKLGTLCIIDTKLRILSDNDKKMINLCGNLVISIIKKKDYINTIKNNENNMKNISCIISHDLINCISPIVSLSNLMIHAPDTISNVLLTHIESSANNAIQLSKNLLDNYKLELHQFSISKTKIFIPDFIKKLYVKDICISCNYSDYLSMDQLRIEQVINNLISNALDFYNKKIELKINLSNCKKNVIFSVEDDGIGIPIEKQHLLFHKFGENINYENKRTNIRSGLGLYICKNIIELHDGQIWIENKSKFCFSLKI